MATDEKMDLDERYQYLRRMQRRYRAAQREEKQRLLDEMAQHTGLHRKSLIRRLKQAIQRVPRSGERQPTYGVAVDAALALIWEASDYVCPERLTPNLVALGELLAQHHELRLEPPLRAQLEAISISTVRRHLPPCPLVHRSRKPAVPANRHQQEIPAYRIPRDIAEAGHFEMDLVHHCGATTTGEYLYTLQLIDVATGWSGRRAILGRSYVVVADALAYLLPRFPFPVRRLHPDNGGEFLNAHLLTFIQQTYPHIELARSRPGEPNDNRLVEQKNETLVRYYVGDRRFDTVMQTRYLNVLYTWLDPFYNFIQPVMKQIDKCWVPATEQRPAYLKRIHDTPRPPLTRLTELKVLSAAQLQVLQDQRAALNPLQLRRQIYQGLDHLFAYPNAAPGEVQNIYQTLADPDRFPEAQAALGAVDTGDKANPALPPVPTAPTTTALTQSLKEEARAG